MTKFQVKLHAVTDMTAFIEIEAETAEAALVAVNKGGYGTPDAKVVQDAIRQAAWEFVDARDAMDVEAREVWDDKMEGVVYPADPPEPGTFVVTRACDAYVRYKATISGFDTAQEAWDYAHNETGLPWIKSDVNEFDASLLGVEDTEGNVLIDETEE